MMKSIFEYKKMITAGEYDAYYFLGFIYRNGIGVRKNSKLAIKYYTLGFEHNVPKCIYALGNCLYRGQGIKKDETKGIELVRSAYPQIVEEANNGDKYSSFIVACYHYLHFIDVSYRDLKKSDEWFEKSAEQGHSEAQAMVGTTYLFGYTTEQDYDKAIMWLTKSAEQGNPVGQHHLGTCYYKGEGVKQDKEKGIELIKKAAAQKFILAEDFLDDYTRWQEGK